MEELPDYEMSKIMFSKELPDNLSFPESHTLYFEKVINFINKKQM